MTGAEWAANGSTIACVLGFVAGVVVFSLLARVVQR